MASSLWRRDAAWPRRSRGGGFSRLQPHWLGFSEVELAVVAHAVGAPRAPLYDAHLRLARGGLFALRGVAAVEQDAADALAFLLGEAPGRGPQPRGREVAHSVQ